MLARYARAGIILSNETFFYRFNVLILKFKLIYNIYTGVYFLYLHTSTIISLYRLFSFLKITIFSLSFGSSLSHFRMAFSNLIKNNHLLSPFRLFSLSFSNGFLKSYTYLLVLPFLWVNGYLTIQRYLTIYLYRVVKTIIMI